MKNNVDSGNTGGNQKQIMQLVKNYEKPVNAGKLKNCATREKPGPRS